MIIEASPALGQMIAGGPRRDKIGEVGHRVREHPRAELGRVTAHEGADGARAERDVADAL